MNRLWARLSLAFALVTVTGIVLAAWLAQRQVETRFRAFAGHNQILAELGEDGASAVDRLAELHANTGGWDGAETLLAAVAPAYGLGRGRGGSRTVVLADPDGRVVLGVGSAPPPAGERLTDAERRTAVPITDAGRTVGLLIVRSPGFSALSASAQAFLDDTSAAFLQAAGLAAVLAALLGVVVARGLAAPLRRLAEAARRISRRDLATRVPVEGPTEIAEVAAAFNEMAEGLSRSEELRAQMVADIAHELRTPLTVIQGNLRAILDDVYALDKQEIAAVYDEARRVGRLVDDLRELAHAEAGQLRLQITDVALAPLLGRFVGAMGDLERGRGVTVELDLPTGLPPVRADADRVAQVVWNLVSNALRHSPDGGRVSVGAEVLGESARVTVADEGSGMSAEEQAHAFDRFWRAEQARSRDGGGSGLGLAIARQWIEAQGGAIGVESAPGRGSRFWFTLPLA